MPSVFVSTRSGAPAWVSVSVALSLALTGSTTPAGGAAAAVFTRSPVAFPAICAVRVNVTDAPDGRSTSTLMLPEPDAGPVPPPE